MADRPMGPEELRAIKESINKEGFQKSDDGEGEGALFIGTKEEVTKAMQRAEAEGRTPDLASFIRMHKEILATPADIQELATTKASNAFFTDYPKKLADMEAGSAIYDEGSSFLYFKDSAGNLARVDIDIEKIGELTRYKNNPSQRRAVVEIQLEQNGFSLDKRYHTGSYTLGQMDLLHLSDYVAKLRRDKENAEKKAGFNF